MVVHFIKSVRHGLAGCLRLALSFRSGRNHIEKKMTILLHPNNKSNLSEYYKRAFEQAVELFVVTAYLTEWDETLTLNPNCRGFRVIIGKYFCITRKAACEAIMRWLPSGLGHHSAHQAWSAATRRRLPNPAATSVVARMEPLAAQSGRTRKNPYYAASGSIRATDSPKRAER